MYVLPRRDIRVRSFQPGKKKKDTGGRQRGGGGGGFGLEQPIATGPANGLFRNAAYTTQRVKQTNMRPKKESADVTS